MLSSYDENSQSLHALEQGTGLEGPLLFSLLLRKLDGDTRHKFETRRGTNVGLPTVDEVIKFLQLEVSYLESANNIRLRSLKVTLLVHRTTPRVLPVNMPQQTYQILRLLIRLRSLKVTLLVHRTTPRVLPVNMPQQTYQILRLLLMVSALLFVEYWILLLRILSSRSNVINCYRSNALVSQGQSMVSNDYLCLDNLQREKDDKEYYLGLYGCHPKPKVTQASIDLWGDPQTSADLMALGVYQDELTANGWCRQRFRSNGYWRCLSEPGGICGIDPKLRSPHSASGRFVASRGLPASRWFRGEAGRNHSPSSRLGYGGGGAVNSTPEGN
uniref:Uncharacterized protein n=1 Tax=Timema bartmani TaxID=61472 RepID=A0A7R9EZX0_9NEOP|nr:unnamed protein product [Timema bartmani]